MAREQLETAIAKAYAGSGDDAAQIVDEVESDLDLTRLMQEMPAVEDLLEAADDAPVIRMINALLTQALVQPVKVCCMQKARVPLAQICELEVYCR
jgi:general secretion pathway protein E